MAIFRLSAKIITRAKGQSVIASAAYRAAEKLTDPNRINDHDYTNRRGVEHTEIMLPANAPAWLQIKPGDKADERNVRQELWQRVEASETRKNAQLAREVLVALPHELNHEQRIELVRDFVSRNFTAQGMVADVALHSPDIPGSKNYHAHILLTLREPTPDGFSKHKQRDWNDRNQLQTWREDWAHCANRHLERAGRPERIDHRTNEARGIDREPQPKLGPIAQEMEKAGRASNAGDDIRAVRERNLQRDIQKLGARALEELEQRLDSAQHPMAKEIILAKMERLLDDISGKGRDSGQDRAHRGQDRNSDKPKDQSRQAVDGRIERLVNVRANLVQLGVDAEEARRRSRESQQARDDERGRERKGDWWK